MPPYKKYFMPWQTAIMYSGKHDFLDWMIYATIHLENPANTGPSYLISFNMSNPVMPPVGFTIYA